jgi:hypothetical protein
MVRYTFLVRLFHPLLHAGLSRRTKLQQLAYRTSYSHRGSYYTLAQVRHGPVGKRPNAFRISSDDRRVCTTFWSTFEMFRQADAELVQQGFLFQRRFRDPAEADLSPICGG